MLIIQQSALYLPTLLPAHSPFPLLAAPPQRPALPAPKIVGYLPAPRDYAAGGTMDSPLQRDTTIRAGVIQSELRFGMSPLQQTNGVPLVASTALVKHESAEKRVKRVVQAEIANPLLLIDIRKDFDAWWAEFERIHGKVKTIEEMDAEIEAKHPGYLAWVARRKARKEQREQREQMAHMARAEVAS